MKILFNCLNLKKGGAERVISILANEFINNNEVTILTLMNMKDSYELSPNIKRIRVDKNDSYSLNPLKKVLKKLSIARLVKFKKEIINEHPDVIISFLPEPSLRLMFVRKFSKKLQKMPVIISIRNDPNIEYKSLIIKHLMKYLYKSVDGMVFQTTDAKAYFDDIINFKNTEIIANPINDEFLNGLNQKVIKYNRIVTVGRLEPQKNHKLLIDVFARVIKKYPDYTLEIYGEGSLRDELSKLINNLGVQNNVKLCGQVDDVKEKLLSSKIFVLSSDYEGMPNALMEAMALGLPCISTNCPCGGPKELIDNGKSGLLIPVNDKDALYKSIIDLINDEKLLENISKNAINIRKNNNAKVIVNKWKTFIKKVGDDCYDEK